LIEIFWLFNFINLEPDCPPRQRDKSGNQSATVAKIQAMHAAAAIHRLLRSGIRIFQISIHIHLTHLRIGRFPSLSRGNIPRSIMWRYTVGLRTWQ